MNLACRYGHARSLHRRGVSLVETLVAVSISATILLVAIGWIHQSFKLAKTVKQKQQHHQQLMRLGDQFRQDVRLCQQVSRNADGRLVLRNPQQGDVVYAVDKSMVSRTYASTASEKTHRENYSLMVGSDIRWDDTELPRWITLTIRRSPGVAERSASSATDASLDLRVRVAVGRWLTESSLVASDEEPNQ